MMQKYELVLKNEKVRSYNRLSNNAVIINAVVLISLCFTSSATKQTITIAGTATALILIGLILIYRFYPTNSKWRIGYLVIFDLLTVTWILLGNYWVAAVQILFSFLSAIAVRKLVVVFYQDKIIFPSFPEKKIFWGQLNNIVLKDGLLTMDFKNNKLLQQIIDESSSSVNEKEFNEFCSKQLKAAISSI